MTVDIAPLIAKEKECHGFMREHFRRYFSELQKLGIAGPAVQSTAVGTSGDMLSIYAGPGLYLILTDYQAKTNPCTFVLDDLKCIYRGHSFSVRMRLTSHLFNTEYRKNHPGGKAVRYDVCMKLDGEDGINICDEPYSNFQWRIVVERMRKSSKTMREQAELGFDDVFRRPLASKEA